MFSPNDQWRLSMWFTFKQVSSFLGVSEYVKSNAYSMIIQAGTFASLRIFLGERHRHDIDRDISALRPLINFHFHTFKTKHWYAGISNREWPELLCDCFYQLSGEVNTRSSPELTCFCLSQGQVQLTSLCKILGHFSFSLSSLRHLFITGRFWMLLFTSDRFTFLKHKLLSFSLLSLSVTIMSMSGKHPEDRAKNWLWV